MPSSSDEFLMLSLERVFAAAGLPASLAGSVFRGEASSCAGVDEPRLALIATDPIGIQEIVQASRRPVTVLGASTALTQWDEALSTRKGVACVYAGGGQALLIAPMREVEALKVSLVREFEHRLYARLAVAALPLSARQLAKNHGGVGFGGLVDALHLLLRAEKGLPMAGKPAWSGPRCTECAVRPAREEVKNDSRPEKRICEVCDAFHRGAEAQRERWGLDDKHRSIADLTDSELAYLAIDGTRMGAALRRQDSLTEYRRFSQALLDAFKPEAILDLLKGEDYKLKWILPVVRGGDDLMLIFDAMAGPGAPAVALALLTHVEETLDSALGEAAKDLGAGAGLVLTRSLPAQEAMKLARALIASAKEGARAAGERSGFDFEVIFGGDVIASDVEAMREERSSRRDLKLGANQPDVTLHMGTRPFGLSHARQLLGIVRGLGNAEVSALRRIGEALADDPNAGLITAAYLLARRPSPRGSETLATRLQQKQPVWDITQPPTEGLVVRSQRVARTGRPPEERWETALPDLLDLEKFSGKDNEKSSEDWL